MLDRIVTENRGYIFEEMLKRLDLLPQLRYREFARSQAGHDRIHVWMDNMILALSGSPQVFLEDTEAIGYLRAHQGFKLEFIIQFYRIFRQIVWEIVQEDILGSKPDAPIIASDLHLLSDILYQGLSRVTSSYMKTREEIIAEKVSQLQTLTGKIMEVQEEERRALAGEIHDNITQSLTAIGYKIQICQEQAENESDNIAGHLDLMLDMVHKTINESRGMISSLRPDLIDTLGLVPALKKHLHQFEMESGVRIRHRLTEIPTMSAQVKICLFRTVQEGLMNIFKHARVDEASIELHWSENTIKLVIKDHGTGFSTQRPPAGAGMGMMMMKERVEAAGGLFRIISEPGQGCLLEVEIPNQGVS